MERVNRIWNHPHYQDCVQQIQQLEQEREFCRHTPEHFIDVARLTYIFVLEAGLPIDKEVIYATALLHDVGRHLEYTQGIPHDQASVDIATQILPACGFTKAEQESILAAIGSHREQNSGSDLSELLYRADKLSRSCFSCPAYAQCKWSPEKKNNQLNY